MPAPRGGGALVRPGAPGGYRPYADPGVRSMRPGFSNGTSRATAPSRVPRSPGNDGLRSSVVPQGTGRASAPPTARIQPGSGGGPWRSFGANRAPATGTTPPRMATAPNALEARNSVSQVLGLSAIHRAFGNSGFGNLRPRPGASTSTSPRASSPLLARPRATVSGTGAAPRNSFRSDSSFNRFRDFGRFRNFDRFRGPFPRFPFRGFDGDFDFDDFFFFGRPFFNCFACGFGFGGFGFGGFNFGFGAPLWWGPAWPVWSGAIGYPYGLPYGYSLPYDYSQAYNSPAYTPPPSDNSSASQASPSTPKSTENSSGILLLYLKDGAMYSVRDSWLAGGQLHYTTTDGSEGVVDLGAVDIQRTVDENAARGVPFTLKPNPATPEPAR